MPGVGYQQPDQCSLDDQDVLSEPMICGGPMAQQTLLGNAELANRAGVGMWGSVSPRQGYANTDPTLDPVRDALNNPGLSHERRAELMLDYRNAQLSRLSPDAGWAMNEMYSGAEGAPAYLSGDKKGVHFPLYEQLSKDPDMQNVMSKLAADINGTDPDKLDIDKIFSSVAKNCAEGELNDPKRDRNLMALQAMATLVNVKKFDPQGKGDGPPKEIADNLPPGLFDAIRKAGKNLEGSPSPTASVMGRNQTDANAFDNNAHFFTHAYLSASMTKEYGLSEKDAHAVCGLIGSQYELLPSSLYEASGNAGLKDILMNGEGAKFGTDFVSGKRRALPAQTDGPPEEDRDPGRYPSPRPDQLPAPVKDISEKSNSKWRMIWNWL